MQPNGDMMTNLEKSKLIWRIRRPYYEGPNMADVDVSTCHGEG